MTARIGPVNAWIPTSAVMTLGLMVMATWAEAGEAPDAGTRRTLIFAGSAEGPSPEIRVAPDTATVLRFESGLDAARTKLPDGEKEHFELPEMAGQSLTLIPRESLGGRAAMTLTVALDGGTPFSLQLVPVLPPAADSEVKVFPEPSTAGALKAALEQANSEKVALRQELAEAQGTLARYREEEKSPDALVAALLLDERTAEHFSPISEERIFSDTLRINIAYYGVANRRVIVFELVNRDPSEPWTLGEVSFTNEVTGACRPFAVRARPSVIPPGGGGRIVIVSKAPPKKSRELFNLRIQAREGPHRSVCVLGLKF